MSSLPHFQILNEAFILMNKKKGPHPLLFSFFFFVFSDFFTLSPPHHHLTTSPPHHHPSSPPYQSPAQGSSSSPSSWSGAPLPPHVSPTPLIPFTTPPRSSNLRPAILAVIRVDRNCDRDLLLNVLPAVEFAELHVLHFDLLILLDLDVDIVPRDGHPHLEPCPSSRSILLPREPMNFAILKCSIPTLNTNRDVLRTFIFLKASSCFSRFSLQDLRRLLVLRLQSCPDCRSPCSTQRFLLRNDLAEETTGISIHHTAGLHDDEVPDLVPPSRRTSRVRA